MADVLVSKLYDPSVGLFRETWGTVEGLRWYWNTEQGEALQLLAELPTTKYSAVIQSVLSNYEAKLQYEGVAFTRYVTNGTSEIVDGDPSNFYIRNFIVGVGGDLTGDSPVTLHEDIYNPSLWLIGYLHSYEVWYNGTYKGRWDPLTRNYGLIQRPDYVEAYKNMSDGNLTYALTFRVLNNAPYIEVWGNITDTSKYNLSDVQVTVAFDYLDRFNYKYLYLPGYGVIEAEGSEQWPVTLSNNSVWTSNHFILYTRRPIGVNKALAVILDSWKPSSELWVYNKVGPDNITYYMWFKIRIHLGNFSPGETKTFRLRVVPMESFDPIHLNVYDYILDNIDKFLHHDLTYAVNTGTGAFKGLALTGIIRASGGSPFVIFMWNKFYETFKGWGWNVATRPLSNFIIASVILYRRTMNQTYLKAAEEAANKLLSLQVRDPSDYRYGGFVDMPMIGVGTYLDVNAEAAHALFKLYDVTGNKTYYDSAMLVLKWIHQDSKGNFYYHRFNNASIFYMFRKEPFAQGYFLQAFSRYGWNDPRVLTAINRIFQLMNFNEYWVKTWDKANETNVETQSSTALGLLMWQNINLPACNGFAVDYVKGANITFIRPVQGGLEIGVSGRGELGILTSTNNVIVEFNNVKLNRAYSLEQLEYPGTYYVGDNYVAVEAPGLGIVTVRAGGSAVASAEDSNVAPTAAISASVPSSNPATLGTTTESVTSNANVRTVVIPVLGTLTLRVPEFGWIVSFRGSSIDKVLLFMLGLAGLLLLYVSLRPSQKGRRR